ncbi:hypothetical protein [Prevotella denticola]|uniref:hypothetical protein n=1 Tax=Prevotella denticola TaxID=28129 RepID=UPI0028ECAE35|nr:hypothetical protein [Prevotella denticola]
MLPSPLSQPITAHHHPSSPIITHHRPSSAHHLPIICQAIKTSNGDQGLTIINSDRTEPASPADVLRPATHCIDGEHQSC